jgi:UDP-glucose 4-epimerase
MDRRASRTPDAYLAANVDATRRLAESAAHAGVRRFVFLSSVSVNGDGLDGLQVSERSPLRPVGGYAESKAQAEGVLVEVGTSTGMQTIALRPPMVYGPGNPGNLLRLMALIRRGLPLPFGAVHNRRSFIAVSNLADAIVRVCGTDRRLGRAYVISDGTGLSTTQLVRLLAEGIGRPPLLVSVPVPWLMLLAGWIGRRDDMQRLTGSFEVDDSAFRRDLDWYPPAAPGPELVATGRWFAERG